MSECGDSLPTVELPLAIELRIVMRRRDICRRHCSAIDSTTLPGRVAIDSDLIQLYHQRIARQSPLNVERSGLEVAAGSTPLAVSAAPVESPRSNGIAGEN